MFNYSLQIQTIKKESKANISPKYCLLDFEEALADGFRSAFPGTVIAKDLFHLKQANLRRLKLLGLKEHWSWVSSDLTVL